MSKKTDDFISAIGPIARNEYLSRDKWILPSICIAQAALESAWNLNARSVFGIKGNGFKSTTSEYYDGHYVEIVDSFREYPDIASSVVGYYDFLRDTLDNNGAIRYGLALNNSDYKDAVYYLIHTSDGAPYATDPNYIGKIIAIIEDFGLTVWDIRPEEQQATLKTYTVQAGDCLSAIASKFNVDMQQLADFNGIENVNLIYPKQVLKIPAKKSEATYTVQAGDCLSTIAEKLGTTVAALAERNNIENVNLIYAGQVLYY